ncbi:MAG: hypothetical protein HY514_00975 [Candidatus Aenigmarchaeota archaeon]|nr:hypothetical protein [Candidatus Aenigmarchaeota archaeon]
MAWPELLKAKRNLENMQIEINRLIRDHNSFRKKEIAKRDDILLAEIDNAIALLEEETEEMKNNIINHRKYVSSKSRFLKRHYSRVK